MTKARNNLERLKKEREEQLEIEKNKKELVPEAPELLNCALIKYI